MDQIQLAAKAIAREQKLWVFIRAVRNGVFGNDNRLAEETPQVSNSAAAFDPLIKILRSSFVPVQV